MQMRCIKPFTFRDRDGTVHEYKAGPNATTYVDSATDVFRAHPDYFEQADERQQKLRNREWESIPLTESIRVRERIETAPRSDSPASCGRGTASVGRTRTVGTATPWAQTGSESFREAEDDQPLWNLEPVPETTGISVHPCIRRYAADEVSCELRREPRERLWGFAERAGELETGGLLFGRRAGQRMMVMRAEESGPDCVRTRDSFTPDLAHDLELALRLYEQDNLQLLGPWHSHSQRAWSDLSEQDLRSAAGWRAMIGGQTLLYALVRRDPRGGFCLWPQIVRASDYPGGADVLRPSRLLT